MKDRLFKGLALAFLTVFVTGCGSTKMHSVADDYKEQSAKDIFQKGDTALLHGANKTAIKHFESLDTLYPFSEYEQQAQLNIIYAYFKDNDFAGASSAAAHYIHLYPRGKNVDYAYYMKGLSNFNQDRGIFQRYIKTDLSKRDVSTAQQSFADFNQLITRFSSSVYAPDAQRRMVFLRNLLAQQQLNVASFYFRKKAYVATINRAKDVIMHYRESPQVIQAFALLSMSYHALGLQKLSDRSLDVLAINFPDSQAYKDAKRYMLTPVKMT